ncbi:MAG: UDP-N-acetylmuramate dehydrogenase [Atopobiaceae bacterium]
MSADLHDAFVALSGLDGADVVRNERMGRRTSYRIGGPAALHVTANTYEALVATIETLHREGVEWALLGKGTNVLVSDAGFSGCVVALGRDFQHTTFGPDGRVTAGAAVILSRLVAQTLKQGLTGLEFCVGIPGTVGGAISMNAGTRREWISRRVVDVVCYHPLEGLRRYARPDVNWQYRSTSLPPSEIVLEATLQLAPGEREAIARDMEERIARRRERQPLGKPSCGSVFRNPPGASVGAMLEACGLKGFSVGGAQVSDIHANFIVNNGTASADDVVAVMRAMHDKVRDTYDVDLQPEVKFLGFSS